MYIVDSHSQELFLCRWYTKETLSEDISSTIIITSPQLWPAALILINKRVLFITRSRWLNCALRDNEAVYWDSLGHYEAVAVGSWSYWVSRGHSCLYILKKIPSEMEVAPRYNCWNCWLCWHCWHCWHCSTLLTWGIISNHFIHICLVPIFQ